MEVTFFFDPNNKTWFRQVTYADIWAAEKKYLQTMEQIISKKKRILVSQLRQKAGNEVIMNLFR